MIGTKSFMAKDENMLALRKWYVVDATDKILGRMAVRIATILMGKHKATYTPHVDTGDFVIILNAEKIKVSGNKAEQKTYQTYSGFSDGQKTIPFKTLFTKSPEKIVELAVKRMLPSTTLGEHMFKKLKVYKGSEHPHQAQNPVKLEI
jgi:large subunit ribosomal protein L13